VLPTPQLHHPAHWPNQMDELELRCCIEGDCRYFLVSISSSQTIYDLQGRIYGKTPVKSFVGCNAKDLRLTKVHYTMIST